MAQTLLQRNRDRLSRMQNLGPLEPKLRTLFMDGKRQHLLTGRNANETPFTRLARSTLAEPRRSPEPFLKSGNASSIITRYTVTTSHAANRLIVTGGWPMTWVHYHVTGGRHLPRRDPGHFRQQDKREAMRLLKTWIKTGHG